MSPPPRLGRRATLGLALAAAALPAFPAPLPAQNAGQNAGHPHAPSSAPLPSWNEGAAKAAILDFVRRTTIEGGPDFVPVPRRIATFDNDGTLWSEQPAYFQVAFALYRLREMARGNPALAEVQPYKAVLSGDDQALAGIGEKGLLQIVALTHSGLTLDAFEEAVLRWARTDRHPRFGRPYTELVYQPMLELLGLLASHGFRTFIVSGGGVEFMRPWVETVYGIPPERVIGSSGKTKYELLGDRPVIQKLPEVEFVDDGPGKPVAINRFIGRRPVFAAGNSDGDLQMLQWTTMDNGPRLALVVHHTDAAREWAYDRQSAVGKLDKALIEAPSLGWLVVDMKTDWKRVYPFET